MRYQSRRAEQDAEVGGRLKQLAFENPRYGSPRLCVLLRREKLVNHKKVERLYREQGLALRRKKRKRIVRAALERRPTERANQEWALDFVADAVASGRHIRILTVVDVHTRECVALVTDSSIGSLRVIRTLEQAILERGLPERIRSDNGPEMTSRACLAWGMERGIELVHIRPGKPVENAHIESFYGRLREECLNVNWFRNLLDARRRLKMWRAHYNNKRPHSALGNRTPSEYALAIASAGLCIAEMGRGGSIATPSSQTHLPASNQRGEVI
jgi:putative transposase